MNFSSLTAISPVDGRYQSKTESLQPYFSEFGLIKYRVQIEVEYLIALAEWKLEPLIDFPMNKVDDLRGIYLNFSETDALWIKEKEKITNHDVKAVEYFLKEKLIGLGLTQFLEFVHFGLTSQES
jgi:adenylosuccinate lyase